MQKAISKYWPVFVLPTLLAFIIGFIWPFIWGIYLSFQRFTTVSKTTFVGLQNYINVFSDETFLHAFGFTAAFTVVSTVLINVCAFAIALVLTRGIRGTNLFRTVYFMPNLIGGILLLGACVLANIMASIATRSSTSRNEAIIIEPSTLLSTSPRTPKDRSEEAMLLHEGTKLEILDSVTTRIDSVTTRWYDVKVDNNNRAWVRASAVERI